MVDKNDASGWSGVEQALKQALVALHGERWDFHWTLYVYNGGEGFEAGFPAPERYDARYPRELEDCWQRLRDAVREGMLPVSTGPEGFELSRGRR